MGGCICGLTAAVVRVLLFASNVLFMLSGIAIIVIGANIQQNFETFDSLFNGAFSGTAIAIIVVGSLICVIGFCGWVGAIRKSPWLLNTYAVLLMIVFVAEIIIGIVALTQVDDTSSYMGEDLTNYFMEEYATPESQSESFDLLQEKLECCGLEDYNDYENLLKPPHDIPSSCCKDLPTTCTKENAYTIGCRTEFTEYVANSVQVIGIVTLCVALCEVIAIVFACCLAGKYKGEK